MQTENVFTVYAPDALTHIQLLDEISRKAPPAKVLASNESALYFDATMISVTFSTDMNFNAFNDVLEKAKTQEQYYVCVEPDWHL